MIGDEWTVITTSLGSLESKETSTNPDFSALTVRLLREASIKKGDRVGVTLSGSFPSLAISVLAALQTLEIDAVVVSSVGASTYGANQPEVTWIDMESNLRKRGGLKYNSKIISMGAQEDAGKDLSEEGYTSIKNAASRNGVDLYVPSSLKESMEKRIELFRKANISLLINIGGNQTSLGECAHSVMIPNGLHFKIDECKDENRGIIERMNEQGIPFINMLDIKDLASRYGIDISPNRKYSESTQLYSRTKTNRIAIGVIVFFCFIPIYILRKRI
jgi:poly-gamma-glutamate system protein